MNKLEEPNPCTCGLWAGTNCGTRVGQANNLKGNCDQNGLYNCVIKDQPAELKALCLKCTQTDPGKFFCPGARSARTKNN